MRALDRCRDEYWDWCYQQYQDAERATNGNLVDPRMRQELTQRHGSVFSALWRTSAKVAWRYASCELRSYWRDHSRLTFTEFAFAAGFRHKFICTGKRRASCARASAEVSAQERDSEGLRSWASSW